MEAVTHVFEDRHDAGRHLAKKLAGYKNSGAVIMAIPRGGVPVAAAAAHRLQFDWSFIVSRRLPIPWNPEAGFGAVTADGAVVINHSMVHELDMTPDQVGNIVSEVRAAAVRRTSLYAIARSPINAAGKCVIVIDDGLASGYTMLAAIKSLRTQGAEKVVAASPVASRSAAQLMESSADECVFEVVSPSVPYSISDFYLDWHNLSDEELLTLLRADQERSSI